ncbi:hypothetical protein [Ramlibacter albus]|uniref:Uncharacterized protein n=1 Tax=Ramlibacter albus TaxID=2079448 RepID=A0A923S557_9BURK|nr:hypothetical protein [Ramlibacter albus]MBC5767603.1 hypothetical protein [Ramlibacter albus]
MEDILAVLWMLTKGIFKIIGHGIYGTCSFVVKTFAPQKKLPAAEPAATRAPKVEAGQAAEIEVPVIQMDPLGETGPSTIIQASPFEVADRIVGVRLEPAVGIIHLRVYGAARVVKRDLIIHEPQLKALMQGRRHAFPDAPYDPKEGLEAIREETIALAEKLINELGNRSVKGAKAPRKDFTPSRTEAPREAVQPPPSARQSVPQAVAQPTTPHVAAPVPLQGHVVAPRIKTGLTYVGTLVRAAAETQSPPGRMPFEVFTATLQLDNGAEMALRGAELERELSANRCRVGERVAITPMGKVPVDLANGEQGAKNLYRVQNMGKTEK